MGFHGWYALTVVLMMICSCRSSNETRSTKLESDSEQRKTTASSMEISDQNQDSIPQVWSREQAQKGPDFFRLVVVFISKGEGPDPEAKSVLEAFLSDFARDSGKRPAYVMIPWGREGEVDCCFNLNELQDREQEVFINNLKMTMSSRELIQVYENAKNRYKR